ncbi:MAG: M55 family metallopeptidase [Defluviitaleaceae bacterium]|nr:M55 family metallopeptidase [Defluviitaleaceae bacterium]MCL2835884.1 M55 family metallopeptidase [Defluviitaleaceae bacterium]
MKIFISSDIEGTNGIASWSEGDKANGGEFNYFAARMTEEVNAVCLGVNDFSPDADILVKDSHATARNIDHRGLPSNTRLNRGWPGQPASMVNHLDGSFDAAIFTGYHSPAFTGGNPMAHTINSAKISRITINGVIAGEFHINYYAALSLGVPPVMVSGDKLLAELVAETDKDILTVVTLEGSGNSTTSAHHSVTLRQLRGAAKEAAARAAELKTKVKSKLPGSFEVTITYRRHYDAFRASYFPGMYVVDDMTVGYKCENFFDYLKAWMLL